ncbi:SAM-dependent methyltransferase [Paractinoplanes lichenicola]|uniref:SAM-dependent methyltransferase n=1 Tax=Paractinoplanes lichenicola TaxID=2802976 RepID=A0ABS1VWB4_9ACTN|nr:SAM-dependent methyltransferase [Actinoplanes lichenicola]MBL7258744.1 SAM-dependent methyltransferase [Actinoplanes lichenicola]
MTESYGWVPEGVDISVPDASRVYDYALGGVHNFAVDREFWHRAEKMFPTARLVARANRAFLGRAVRHLSELGVRQFLDIGSGIPTLGNVHEVAQEADPEARVMYVDIDPIAVQQSRSLLTGNPYARVIEADLRKPDGILYHPEVLDLFDFSEPVAVLTVAVLHFVPDGDDPVGLLHRLGEPLVSSSYLVISHLGPDATPEGREAQEQARRLYEKTPTPVVIRTREQVAALLDDSFELVEPGVVSATEWRPDPDESGDPPQPTALVALARKRNRDAGR